jgi:hypothetical protein
VNFSLLNKLNNNPTQIINKPFLNLIYFHFNFFQHLIKTQAEQLDRGEPIFSPDVYNYFKTKDMKYMSIGNLEPKFQESTKSILEALNNNNGNYKFVYEKDKNTTNNANSNNPNIHDMHSIQRIFENYDRDELFAKVSF